LNTESSPPIVGGVAEGRGGKWENGFFRTHPYTPPRRGFNTKRLPSYFRRGRGGNL